MKVLITGATSGIGFLTGIVLNDRNHKVYMTTHTKEQLETLNNNLSQMGINDINTFKLDITNTDDVEKIKELDIDVLINHAGIGIGGSIIDIDIDKVKENFEVNFFSTFNLSKIFCNKLLAENKKGKLLITSSIAGIIPFEFLGSYCSSKAAITMMASCLRKELKYKKSNISVSLIEPGSYKTGFNQVMVDSVDYNIDESSYFYDIREKIYNILNLQFDIVEKRDINSIVCQIIKAVEDKQNKFIYTAPFSQKLIKKIYLLLFR